MVWHKHKGTKRSSKKLHEHPSYPYAHPEGRRHRYPPSSRIPDRKGKQFRHTAQEKRRKHVKKRIPSGRGRGKRWDQSLSRLPSASAIAKKAKELAMQRQAMHMEIGDPITPSEAELKESGYTHEARISLMQSPETPWEAEQHRYIHEMASEMGLKVVTKKEYAMLQRIMQEPRNHKYVRNGKKPKRLKREFAKTIRKTRQPTPMKRVSLRQPLNLGSALRGASLPRIHAPMRMTIRKGIPSIRDIAVFHSVVQDVAKKRKKRRRRNHSARVGKTPRRLRKLIKNGKKQFSFPDHIWKVKVRK